MGKHRYAASTRRFADVEHAPCVYAAELSTGIVKVGTGGSARARLMSLANEVKREHGAELCRFSVVTKRTAKAAFEAETRLVHTLERIARPLPGRREFFSGISFAAAVRAMKKAS